MRSVRESTLGRFGHSVLFEAPPIGRAAHPWANQESNRVSRGCNEEESPSPGRWARNPLQGLVSAGAKKSNPPCVDSVRISLWKRSAR